MEWAWNEEIGEMFQVSEEYRPYGIKERSFLF